jgi:hypothetical protein
MPWKKVANAVCISSSHADTSAEAVAAMAEQFAAGAGLPNPMTGIPDLSTVVRAGPVDPGVLPPRGNFAWSSKFREDFNSDDVEAEPQALEAEAEPSSRELNEGSSCLSSVKTFLTTVFASSTKCSTSSDVKPKPLLPIVSTQLSSRESMVMPQTTQAAVPTRPTLPRRNSFLKRHSGGASDNCYFVAGDQIPQVINTELVEPVRAADVHYPVVPHHTFRVIPFDSVMDEPVPMSDGEDEKESETWAEISLMSPQLPAADFGDD